MRPTARVETLGSFWLIDEIDNTYLRLPKGEAPRTSPPGKDWTGSGAGVMQDYVWHPYIEWLIEDGHHWVGEHADGTMIDIADQPVLKIFTPDHVITAPCAQVVTT